MERDVIEMLYRMIEGRKVVTKEEIARKIIRAHLVVLGKEARSLTERKVSNFVNNLFEEFIKIKNLQFVNIEKDGISFYVREKSLVELEDFKISLVEYEKSKKFFNSLHVMRAVTDSFFEDYEVDDGEYIRRYVSGDKIYNVVYSLIEDVYEDFEVHKKLSRSFNGIYTIVVPTEKKIDPFLDFYSQYSEEAKRERIRIWVVNTVEKSVDPFIGYPNDLRLVKKFKNPKLASIMSSLWRTKVDEESWKD
ncbi:MAG: hypothetical protein QXM06_00630 [Archaeoglobaceae archaeon]